MSNRRGKSYTRVFHLALGLLALGLLVACASAPSPTPQVEVSITPTATATLRGAGDTLSILHPEAPTILNPHLTSSVKDWEVCRITYEPLASFDKDGNMIPFLAAQVPSLENGGVAADGKSVTWKLKRDLKWSDGQPFTADDVLFTYQFITNPDVAAASKGIYTVIQSVELIDAYTVKLNFSAVNPAWALPFVGFRGMILPRHVFQDYNGANARTAPANTLPVGTGPYQAVSPGLKPQEVLLLGTQLVETKKVVFVPNPYFREADKPFFGKVEFRGGGTVNEAARLVLQAGGVDYAYGLELVDPETLTRLQSAGQGSLIANFGAKVDRILLNRTDPNRETSDGERSSLQFPHPFLSDKRVRQAFAYAIDREAIAALYGQTGRPTYNNLVAPPQYNSPNVYYKFDLEKAQALLDEAGWKDSNGDGVRDKDGVKMKVVFQTLSTISQQYRQIVKEALESIGVEVELTIFDPSIAFGAGAANPNSFYRFNADMQEVWFKSANLDPSAFMQNWTCARIPQKANNWAGLNGERWCNPDYDALHTQSATEMDPDKRAQLFIRMNDMQTEDVVMIPVVHMAEVQGVSPSLEGVDVTPWDANTWNIKDWRRK